MSKKFCENVIDCSEKFSSLAKKNNSTTIFETNRIIALPNSMNMLHTRLKARISGKIYRLNHLFTTVYFYRHRFNKNGEKENPLKQKLEYYRKSEKLLSEIKFEPVKFGLNVNKAIKTKYPFSEKMSIRKTPMFKDKNSHKNTPIFDLEFKPIDIMSLFNNHDF